MATDMTALRAQLVETAAAIVKSGAISMSGHGNISIRVPGRDEIIYTAASSLANFQDQHIARLRLDGSVLEGEVSPMSAAVISMHIAIYEEKPDTGCVLHTHSPFATAFAVANRPIECWIEALAMFGLPKGVPVARYGPRGSEVAVANIREAVVPGTPAVLLANHGVLVFHRSPELAVLVGGVVEEAAMAAINASAIGGPVAIPEELRAAALQRAMAFEAEGTQRA